MRGANVCYNQAELLHQPTLSSEQPGTLFSGPRYGNRIKSIMDAFVPQEELSCILQDSKHVPRICGAWVGVLPKIVQHCHAASDCALSLSIEALLSSVTLKPYAASIQTYNAAIAAVRKAITLPKHLGFTAEIATAIMCLTLSEVLIKCATI